jgi:hypothetical protein
MAKSVRTLQDEQQEMGWVLGFFLVFIPALAVSFWPLLVFHGVGGWVAEGVWVVVLVGGVRRLRWWVRARVAARREQS